MCSVCFGPSRRGALAGLLALGLAGCSENPASGRRQFVFIEDSQLVQLADQSWAQLRAKIPLSEDPALNARLARIAAPIARATGREDLDWRFAVLDSPELNAFVLPNGQVGFFRGIMEFAQSDDELGAVMGHEAAHLLARHPAERVSQELAVNAGLSLAQIFLSGENGENAELIAGALGLGATYGVLLPYSRKHELEADRLGVELMRKAGMEPAAAIRFWERMIASQARGGQPIEALSTHPADDRRLAELQQAIAAA